MYDAIAPIAPEALADTVRYSTDPLNGKKTASIPGYGCVSAQVLTCGTEFSVKCWDSPAMVGCTYGPYATRDEAQGVADAYLFRAVRQEVL
jgi:hypothetical protein